MPFPFSSPDAPPSQDGPVESLPPIRGPLDPGIVAAVELLRAEGLATTDSGDGYSKKEAIEAGDALDFGHVFIVVEGGMTADDIIACAAAIPWTDYGYRVPTVELLERASDSDEPEAVGVMWQPGELMDTGKPLPPMLTGNWCLHCKLKAATKVEGADGFTLCSDCWHTSELGPVVDVAATLAEMQLSEAQQLAGKLGRWKGCARAMARDLLYHGPLRNLPSEQFEALQPGDLAREAKASVIRLEAVCDEASEVRHLCGEMGVKLTADGQPIPLVDLLRHILVSDIDYGNRYSLLQRAETEEGRAADCEEYAEVCRKDAAKYRRWARGES